MAHIDPSARIEANILDRYLRVAVEPVFRLSVLMNELERRNRISFKNHGKKLSWRPRYRRRTITAGLGNPISISFPQTPIRREVTLPWRHYQLGESVAKYETLVSQNPETALFDIVEEVTRTCVEDFLEDFRLKLYGDGNLAPGRDIHGFDSFTSVNGCVTDSVAGDPNDTYAGTSTALNQAGDWSGDWPIGTGDSQYCWWSPLVVDVNNALFSGAANGLSSTWQQAIRYATSWGAALQKRAYDMLILCTDWSNIIRQSMETNERFIVTSTSGSGTHDVGFKTLEYEGLKIATEYGCPDNSGYFFSFDEMELMCLTDQLLESMTDTDITQGGQILHAFQFFGNLKWSAPSFFAKLVEITALGTS